MNNIVFPILINIAGWGLVLWVFYCINYHIPQKRLVALFEQTSPDAVVRSVGIIRQGLYEGPGVAQILNGDLCLYTIEGLVFQIPIDQVKVTKIRKNNHLTGLLRGQNTVFCLETPKTYDLRIRVSQKDAELWENLLKSTDSRNHFIS